MYDGWRMKPRWVAALVLFCLVIGLYPCMAVRRTPPAMLAPPSDEKAESTLDLAAEAKKPFAGADVRVHIALLSKESMEASLTNLNQPELFTWPGAGRNGGGSVQDFHAKIEDGDLMSVFSNRRFLKLLGELGRLSQAQASDVVSRHLRGYLSVYEDLYAEEILADERLYRDNLRV